MDEGERSVISLSLRCSVSLPSSYITILPALFEQNFISTVSAHTWPLAQCVFPHFVLAFLTWALFCSSYFLFTFLLSSLPLSFSTLTFHTSPLPSPFFLTRSFALQMTHITSLPSEILYSIGRVSRPLRPHESCTDSARDTRMKSTQHFFISVL